MKDKKNVKERTGRLKSVKAILICVFACIALESIKADNLFLSLYISFFLSAIKRILIIVEEDKIEKGVWGKRKRRGIAKEE